MDDKKNIYLMREGRWYCPRCGHEMGWDSQEMNDCELPEEDQYIVTYYSCQHCGLSLEIYDTPPVSERSDYPYWNEDQEK